MEKAVEIKRYGKKSCLWLTDISDKENWANQLKFKQKKNHLDLKR